MIHMIAKAAKTGTSFKGASLYYLHDKRMDGEQQRMTSERVDWTATRGLATDDPQLAVKIMIATAKDQDRLKAEAEIKNTGRKSPNSVYSYSLAWHPEEKGNISKAEMLRACDESIRAIGAEGHQAVYIAHNDEAHPHVHIMINRVNPENGKMLSTSNDYRKLDAWAFSYRKERGEEHKYCPAREEKARAVEQKRQGLKTEFVKSNQNTPYQQHMKEKSVANDNDLSILKRYQREKDARLADFGKKMHERHSKEWAALSAKYWEDKSAIYARYGSQIKQAPANIKEAYCPAWRELYSQQWKEMKDFEKREQHLGGKIKNALDAVIHSRKLDSDNSRGFVSSAFNYMINSKSRTVEIERLHASQKRALGSAMREEIGGAIKNLKNAQSAELKQARTSFKSERQNLIDRQAADKANLSHQWKQRNVERKAAFKALDRKAEIRRDMEQRYTAKEPDKSQQQKDERLRKAFEKANFIKERQSSRQGRGRSRSRGISR